MINVTKPFLPPQEKYTNLVKGIWERAWLTNNGPLVQELEMKLKQYLNVSSLHYVSNGTIALQLAIKALDLSGEIITTPFSFVATTTAILWEGCTPVYVDIRPDTLCIDADKIEEAITEKTSAILATHVYGIPESILQYGDLSTLSFHATKVFHTIEGGGIVNNVGPDIDKFIVQLKNFGQQDNIPIVEGINGKNSEFHAAMGICNLEYINLNLIKRKKLSEMYNNLLNPSLQVLKIGNEVEYNYAYFPILFESEELLLKVKELLQANSIQSRRYFHPSLNNLP